MSTNPETTARADDRLVTVISRWLARHVSDDELQRELEQVGCRELAAEQVEAVEELRAELSEDRKRAEPARTGSHENQGLSRITSRLPFVPCSPASSASGAGSQAPSKARTAAA